MIIIAYPQGYMIAALSFKQITLKNALYQFFLAIG